jgi:hypothetical protein
MQKKLLGVQKILLFYVFIEYKIVWLILMDCNFFQDKNKNID